MSRPLIISFAASLIFVWGVHAAFELDDLETSLPFARQDGLAGNPAELVTLPCPRWALQYHLPFGLHKLRHNSLSMALPYKKLRLSAGLASTGFSLHRELSAWLGGGLPLSRNLALGASITILYLQQENRTYRNQTQTLGLRIKIGTSLELGLWQRGSSGLAPPSLFLKLVHRPDAQSLVYAHLRHHPQRPHRLDLAAEHRLHPRFHLRLGTRSTPRRFALGTRIVAGGWKITYAVTTHTHLGPSHTFATGNTCRSP